MRTSAAQILTLAGGLLGLSSCGSLIAPDEVLVIGILSNEPQLGLPIEIPDTVAVDAPFAVTVRTMGSGCGRIGPTEVSAAAVNATVTPYDHTAQIPGESVDCDLVLKIFEHRAALLFETVGSATITVRARHGSGVVQDFVSTLWVR